MSDTEGWAIFFGGVVVLAVLFAILFPLFQSTYDDQYDGCILLSEYGNVFEEWTPGEDDGAVYCPTGEVSNSQIGKVLR